MERNTPSPMQPSQHAAVANLPEVTLLLKCGVMTRDGVVDRNSYKYLTWSFVSDSASNGHLSHVPLNQRILDVYPYLEGEPTRIVYIGMICSTGYEP